MFKYNTPTLQVGKQTNVFFSHFQNYISNVILECKKNHLVLAFIGYIKCLKNNIKVGTNFLLASYCVRVKLDN